MGQPFLEGFENVRRSPRADENFIARGYNKVKKGTLYQLGEYRIDRATSPICPSLRHAKFTVNYRKINH